MLLQHISTSVATQDARLNKITRNITASLQPQHISIKPHFWSILFIVSYLLTDVSFSTLTLLTVGWEAGRASGIPGVMRMNPRSPGGIPGVMRVNPRSPGTGITWSNSRKLLVQQQPVVVVTLVVVVVVVAVAVGAVVVVVVVVASRHRPYCSSCVCCC